jgi:hypothetical protein
MFEDGGEEITDYVVGADGIRNVCSWSFYGTDEKHFQFVSQ